MIIIVTNYSGDQTQTTLHRWWKRRGLCLWACLALSLRQVTSSEFLLCTQKTITPLPKCTQNLIPTENIQRVKNINTLQTHPIGKQGQTFEMARAIKQHILQSKELKCSIYGQHELVSMAKFFWCICWKTMLQGSESHHFCLGTELSPPLWMLPSVYLKVIPNKLRYPHMAV